MSSIEQTIRAIAKRLRQKYPFVEGLISDAEIEMMNDGILHDEIQKIWNSK